MIYRTMTAEEQSDTELVSRGLAGDRDAFSHIVSRYQTLICSLAYSRIGNLGQSEDIAQETRLFIVLVGVALQRSPANYSCHLPTNCGIVPAPVEGRAHFWSAAGSEAPRRFGFGARAGAQKLSGLEARKSAVAATLCRRTPKSQCGGAKHIPRPHPGNTNRLRPGDSICF